MMIRIKWLTVCILFLLAVAGTAVPAPVQAQSNAQEMFRLVNEFRAELGLPAFTWNAALAAAAQQQANYMVATNSYTHTGAGGTTPQDRATAAGYGGYVTENVVGGTNTTPRKGLIWWKNSQVHYNTLVSTRYTEAGVGYAADANGQHRFALVAGRPSNRPVTERSSGRNDSNPAPLIIEPVVLAEPNEDGAIIHTVGQGQALWTLSAHYEVPLADILLYNDLSESALVVPGDEIIIQPGENWTPPPTPTPPLTHVVRDGQTLWTIAAAYNIKLPDLLWINGLREDAYIQPGDELRIRLQPGEAPPPTATPQIMHVVQDGQTAWTVAAMNGLSLDELYDLNGIDDSTILQPGDELRVREAVTVPPTATPTAAPTQTPTAAPTATLTANESAAIPVVEEAPSSTPTDTPIAVTATAIPAVSQALLPSSPSASGRLLVLGGGLLTAVGAAWLVLNRQY